MGGQVVHDHADPLRLGKVRIDHGLQLVRESLFGSPLGHVAMAPAGQGLPHQEQVAGACPLVLVSDPVRAPSTGGGTSPTSWYGSSSKPMTGRVGAQGSAYRSKTASIRQPNAGLTLGMHQSSLRHGLSAFFLSVRRTVSLAIVPTTSRVTTWSAKSCLGHSWRPAQAIRKASC